MSKSSSGKPSPGVGLDCGTMNFVAARKIGQKVETTRVRDAFLDLDPAHKKMLKISNTGYVELAGRLLVVGDEALETANLMNKEARRPMSGGILNAGELDAQQVIGIMMQKVLGDPAAEKEKCCYSVPAPALDVIGSDVSYHKAILGKILGELGFKGEALNEAQAIVFSECVKDNFSGIGISYGSGMTNVCLSYNAMSALEFSIAKCLADDFPVVTKAGVRGVCEVNSGDFVLGADGRFVEVMSRVSNGIRDTLSQLDVELMPAFPLRLTSDHRVFVKSGFNWAWKEAREVSVGDVVGVPIIGYDGSGGKSYYFGCSSSQKLELARSKNLGRFFGSFLGDGKSCVPSKGGYVELSLNEGDSDLVDKYLRVLEPFGNPSVRTDKSKPGVSLIHVESKILASHMRSFYSPDGEKTFPIPLCSIPDQMAVGILEGLFDTDGHLSGGRICFTTTSRSIVMVVHHLLNRFSIRHRIANRPPREGGINHRGERIVGRKDVYEVRVTDFMSNELFRAILLKDGHFHSGPRPNFVEYSIFGTHVVPYGREVWDLSVASDHHSFSSPCAVVHNCGDWIDRGAAQAVGSTAGKMCSLKESGVDISAPSTREQEAIAFFVRQLIEYSLAGIIQHFDHVRREILVPKPIPIVVSGGTSLAGGFLDVFKHVFEEKRSSFPVEISDIRHARDPMTAVATGLLTMSQMED